MQPRHLAGTFTSCPSLLLLLLLTNMQPGHLTGTFTLFPHLLSSSSYARWILPTTSAWLSWNLPLWRVRSSDLPSCQPYQRCNRRYSIHLWLSHYCYKSNLTKPIQPFFLSGGSWGGHSPLIGRMGTDSQPRFGEAWQVIMICWHWLKLAVVNQKWDTSNTPLSL